MQGDECGCWRCTWPGPIYGELRIDAYQLEMLRQRAAIEDETGTFRELTGDEAREAVSRAFDRMTR